MRIIVAILLSILISCNSEIRDIKIRGVIQDRETSNGIPYANVTALCWKNVHWDDVDYVKKEMVADSLGNFTFEFEKGFKVDIAGIANNYYPIAKEFKLSNKNQHIHLKLPPSNDTSTSIYYQGIILSIRNYAKSNKSEFWGIKFNKSGIYATKNEPDIWIEQTGSTFPDLLKTGNLVEGVIPINNTDVNGSLLFDKNIAPIDGYIKEYKLGGNEAGFFVKLSANKGFAKIVLEKIKIKNSIPVDNQYYDEKGIAINVVYQPNGSRDLSIIPNVDLEQFILKEI